MSTITAGKERKKGNTSKFILNNKNSKQNVETFWI